MGLGQTSRPRRGQVQVIKAASQLFPMVADKLLSLASEREEKFRWSEVGRGVLNLQVWLSSTAYFAILSGLYSFGLFVSLVA